MQLQMIRSVIAGAHMKSRWNTWRANNTCEI